MAVHFDADNLCYFIRGSIGYYVFHTGIQLALVASFVATYLNRRYILVGDFIDTEHYYNYLSMQTTFLSHTVLRLWLICNQHNNLRLLESCRKKWWNGMDDSTVDGGIFDDYTRNLLMAFAVSAVIYFVNLIIMLSLNSDGLNGSSLLIWTGFTYCWLTITLILYVYIFIVITISRVLKSMAHRCEMMMLHRTIDFNNCTDLRHLQYLFNLYDDITYAVWQDVNCVYGIAILFSTITLINESIWDVYELAMSNSETNYFNQLQTTMWMVPICIFLFVGLWNSNVPEEVSASIFISPISFVRRDIER